MISKEEYQKILKNNIKPSPKPKDFIVSFISGGLICVIGQAIYNLLLSFEIKEDIVRSAVPSILIFIASLLTGIGIYDKIAKHCGAGTLVPITGFSNAVTSCAIEFKNEGFILGVGDNIFKIAGPVILYGTAASIIYGLIYYFYKIIGG